MSGGKFQLTSDRNSFFKRLLDPRPGWRNPRADKTFITNIPNLGREFPEITLDGKLLPALLEGFFRKFLVADARNPARGKVADQSATCNPQPHDQFFTHLF